MGQSTDAYLVYGIEVEEDSYSHAICEALQDERYKEHSEATREFGVEAISHCSHDYPMYIIVSTKLANCAYRGHPKKLDIAALQLVVDEDSYIRDNIDKFFERFGIVNDKKYSWILCSDWS